MKKSILVFALSSVAMSASADYNLIFGNENGVSSLHIFDSSIMTMDGGNIVSFKQTIQKLHGEEIPMLVEYDCTSNRYKMKAASAKKWNQTAKADKGSHMLSAGGYACEYIKKVTVVPTSK